MKPTRYSPPYKSPIEDTFAKNVEKYLSQDVDLTTQVEIETICGRFRMDFIAVSPDGKTTGFECDGKTFHEEGRDEWRDAMILGTGKVDEIYRIEGKYITYQIEDVFYVISKWSPWLFDERRKYILGLIASEAVTDRDVLPEESLFSIHYFDQVTNELQQLRIVKRHNNIPVGKRQFWQAAFRFAQQAGGGNLDEVMLRYRRK